MLERPTTIAVVMAVYNRRGTTLRCLKRLFSQESVGVNIRVHMLDDASPDGTADAVRTLFPQVKVIDGDGQRFWGGGMHLAMVAAQQEAFDFLLWLNDDVELDADALARLLAAHQETSAATPNARHVIVGSVRDPATGELSYAGFVRRNRWHPAQVDRALQTTGSLTQCDTMNGNCVLVPRALVAQIGILDPVFIQQLGDIDYGYRVRRAGGYIWATAAAVGACEPNNKPRPWRDPRLGFRERLILLNTPHGLPVRPWFTFMWRYGGALGLVLLLASYAKALGCALISGRDEAAA